jgi:hypothetical protein
VETWDGPEPESFAEIAQLVADGARVSQEVPEAGGATPLHLACQARYWGAARVVAELLRLGADPHARTPGEGNTPLHFAALGGGAEVVRALCLGRGAGEGSLGAAGWRDEWNFTLGEAAGAAGGDNVSAAGANETAGAEGPVNNGTSPEPPEDRRHGLLRNSKFEPWKVEAERRALHAAAVGPPSNRPQPPSPLNITRRLPEPALRALLDARNAGGATPLHLAAAFGQEQAVLSLLQLGADPRARDADGRSPADHLDELEFENVCAQTPAPKHPRPRVCTRIRPLRRPCAGLCCGWLAHRAAWAGAAARVHAGWLG